MASVSPFSSLRYAKFNSALARRALSLFYKAGGDYRIPFGPLKGMRLHYDRSINYHAILGLWDLEAFHFLERALADWLPGRTVADVGANIGIFSLWASRRVGKSGKVYAFEPAPYASAELSRNLALNKIRNVEKVEAACAGERGQVDFFLGHHHHTSSLIAEWAANGGAPAKRISVPSVALESVCSPDLIKMDIEGGAAIALNGMKRLFREQRPLLWIESHSPVEDRALSNLMIEHGYRAYRLQTKSLVENPRATHPDPDGVWGTLLLYPAEGASHFKGMFKNRFPGPAAPY